MFLIKRKQDSESKQLFVRLNVYVFHRDTSGLCVVNFHSHTYRNRWDSQQISNILRILGFVGPHQQNKSSHTDDLV